MVFGRNHRAADVSNSISCLETHTSIWKLATFSLVACYIKRKIKTSWQKLRAPSWLTLPEFGKTTQYLTVYSARLFKQLLKSHVLPSTGISQGPQEDLLFCGKVTTYFVFLPTDVLFFILTCLCLAIRGIWLAKSSSYLNDHFMRRDLRYLTASLSRSFTGSML